MYKITHILKNRDNLASRKLMLGQQDRPLKYGGYFPVILWLLTHMLPQYRDRSSYEFNTKSE